MVPGSKIYLLVSVVFLILIFIGGGSHIRISEKINNHLVSAVAILRYLWIPLIYFFIVVQFGIIEVIFLFAVTSMAAYRYNSTDHISGARQPIPMILFFWFELLFISRLFNIIIDSYVGTSGLIIYILCLVFLLFGSGNKLETSSPNINFALVMVIPGSFIAFLVSLSTFKSGQNISQAAYLLLASFIFFIAKQFVIKPVRKYKHSLFLIFTSVATVVLLSFIWQQNYFVLTPVLTDVPPYTTLILLPAIISLFLISVRELLRQDMIPEMKRILLWFLRDGSVNKNHLIERLTIISVLIFSLIAGSINLEQFGLKLEILLILYVVLLLINRYSYLSKYFTRKQYINNMQAESTEKK